MADKPKEPPAPRTVEELHRIVGAGGGPVTVTPGLAKQLTADPHPAVREAMLQGERLGVFNRLRKLFDAHSNAPPGPGADHWRAYLLDSAQLLAMEAHYLDGKPWEEAWRAQVARIVARPKAERQTAIAEIMAEHRQYGGEIVARLMPIFSAMTRDEAENAVKH